MFGRKDKMKKKIIPVVAFLLAALLLLSGCASHGKTLIEAGNTEISVNVFQLYLSRMKGSLKSAGNDVNNQEFWDTYVGLDNQTQSDYYTHQVFEGLRQIAAALVLYDELGLALDPAVTEEIDLWIETLIEEVGEGSKSQLNSVLSAYGANITVLRDAALIEAKIAQLKTHLYGEDGSLISDVVKEQFYQDTYYRGQQMLIANYYHDHAKDKDGATIYYLTDGDGNLTDRISYDKEKGTATEELDEKGDTVYRKFGSVAYDTKNGTAAEERDENGDLIYYKDGKIAYDAKNGKATEETDKNGDTVYRKWVIAYDSKNGAVKYYYDAKGNNKIAYYTTEEMAKRLLAAEKIAEECKGNAALFEQYMAEFSDNIEFNEKYAPNGMYFSVGTYTTDDVFYTFSTELAKLEIGDLAILKDSNAGYYVIMRTELDAGAWQQEANARWFGTLTGLVMEYMLQQRAAEYLDRVVVDEALKETVDITMVDANNYY